MRAIGSSNFSAEQLEQARVAADTHGLTSFVSEQSEYSWLVREAEEELLPTSERLGVGFIPHFPLASGLLTGKYRRGEPAPEGTRLHGRDLVDADLDRVERLSSFADECGVSLLDVAIGGLAAQPAVASVIAGATKPEQVRANAEAGGWRPSSGELEALLSL